MRYPNQFITRLLIAALALVIGACRSIDARLGNRMDATVVLATSAEGELGVSTDYGVVFLGQSQKSGEVRFTAWFQDGPSLETGLIEPIGSELYLTHAEIQLPTTPLTFQVPSPGTTLQVSGRKQGKLFRFSAEVASDPSVEGLLLKNSSALEALTSAQMGAGVYLEVDGVWKLVGLLSGRLEISGESGTRSYHTMAGPARLWRLAASSRDQDQPKLLPKRGDILPR